MTNIQNRIAEHKREEQEREAEIRAKAEADLRELESQRDVSMANHADDYAKMYKEIAELRAKLEAVSKERDELAAQVDVMREALTRIKGGAELWHDKTGGWGGTVSTCEAALSITPSEALREVKARTLEDVAAKLKYEWNGDSDTYVEAELDNETCEWLLEMAAAIRRGE